MVDVGFKRHKQKNKGRKKRTSMMIFIAGSRENEGWKGT